MLPLLLAGLASGAISLLSQKKVQTSIGGLVSKLINNIAGVKSVTPKPKKPKARKGITVNW